MGELSVEHFFLEGNSKKNASRQGDYARKTTGLLVLFLAARLTDEAEQLKSADRDIVLLLWTGSGPVCDSHCHLSFRVCNDMMKVALKLSFLFFYFFTYLCVFCFCFFNPTMGSKIWSSGAVVTCPTAGKNMGYVKKKITTTIKQNVAFAL